MDRLQLLLIGLTVFLFCSDLLNLLTLSPPPPKNSHHHPPQQPVVRPNSSFPTQITGVVEDIGYGNIVDIIYCSSRSHESTMMTMNKMLDTSFPGIEFFLTNHPAKLPKRLLSKVVSIIQIGVLGILMAGDKIFPELGYMTLPPWYFSLRTNKFGTIASTWLFGYVVQPFLQSSGAFEVCCNGKLVFSKLKEKRFPSEFELKELVSQKLLCYVQQDFEW